MCVRASAQYTPSRQVALLTVFHDQADRRPADQHAVVLYDKWMV